MIPVYKPFWPKKSRQYAIKALEDGWLANHDNNIIVEECLANLLGVKHVILTCNGTVATHLVAKGLKYKHPEIENIIVPNIVYVAAWNAFLMDKEYKLTMAKTNQYTWNMDTLHVAELSKAKNTAILAVHNLGNPVSVSCFDSFGVPVVEDACEAIFGSYCGKKIPSQSLISSLSFFGNKTITSGEGGAVVTNDDEVAEYLTRLRGQGQTNHRYIHDILGYNYRMTNIQAAILRGQLDCVDEILERKNDIWNYYNAAFSNRNDLQIQMVENENIHSKWMYGIRIFDRKESFEVKQAFFNSRGIDIRPMFYTIGNHKHLINNKDVMICNDKFGEDISKSTIMLPSYPELTKEDLSLIVSCVNDFVM